MNRRFLNLVVELLNENTRLRAQLDTARAFHENRISESTQQAECLRTEIAAARQRLATTDLRSAVRQAIQPTTQLVHEQTLKLNDLVQAVDLIGDRLDHLEQRRVGVPGGDLAEPVDEVGSVEAHASQRTESGASA